MKKPLYILLMLTLSISLVAAPFAVAEGIAAEPAAMDWTALLSSILYAVISVVVPVLTKYAVDFLRKKRDETTMKIENEKIKQGLCDAMDAVLTAVTVTSQTYVDNLKEDGLFDETAQREAFHKAFEVARNLLTDAAQDALAFLYGGVDDWLSAKIEQSVRDSKGFVASTTMIDVPE